MTQNEMVIKYIEDHGSITPLEAEVNLGIMRLASRISDLKSAGYHIEREMVDGENRRGEPTRYARYSFPGGL